MVYDRAIYSVHTRYKRVIPTEQKHNGTLTVAAWARKVILLFVLGPKGLKI